MKIIFTVHLYNDDNYLTEKILSLYKKPISIIIK